MIALIGLFSACSSGPTPEQTAMMNKEATNKAAFENIMKAFEAGDKAAMGELLADNFMTHNPDASIKSTGKQHWLDQMDMYRAASPDMKGDGKAMVAEGDWVAGVAMVKGTNTGDMGPGMPATNKPWECTGIDMIRFENGKAVEHWGVFDVMTMMTQLGMMPTPGSEMAMEKEHVCSDKCKDGNHMLAHGEKGHVCAEECKKMMEEKKG